MKKRFRVWSIDEQKIFDSFDTTLECYHYLTSFKDGDYFVDDRIDNTEVNWVDFMNAFEKGEFPKDLTLFEL